MNDITITVFGLACLVTLIIFLIMERPMLTEGIKILFERQSDRIGMQSLEIARQNKVINHTQKQIITTEPLYKKGDVIDVIEHDTDTIEKGTIIDEPEWKDFNGICGWWFKVMTESRVGYEETECIGSGGAVRKPYHNELFQFYLQEDGIEFTGMLPHWQFR